MKYLSFYLRWKKTVGHGPRQIAPQQAKVGCRAFHVRDQRRGPSAERLPIVQCDNFLKPCREWWRIRPLFV